MNQSNPEQAKQKRRKKGSLRDSAIAALLAPTTDPIILAKKRAASRLGNAVKKNKADMRKAIERANNPAVVIERKPTTSQPVTVLRRSRLLAAEAMVGIVQTLANIVQTGETIKDRISAGRLLADISGITKLTEDSVPSDLRDYSADDLRRMIVSSKAREAALLEQSTHETE